MYLTIEIFKEQSLKGPVIKSFCHSANLIFKIKVDKHRKEQKYNGIISKPLVYLHIEVFKTAKFKRSSHKFFLSSGDCGHGEAGGRLDRVQPQETRARGHPPHRG